MKGNLQKRRYWGNGNEKSQLRYPVALFSRRRSRLREEMADWYNRSEGLSGLKQAANPSVESFGFATPRSSLGRLPLKMEAKGKLRWGTT